MDQQPKNTDLVRSFVFGVEDSLVSTVGLISGVAVGGLSRSNLLLTGMVLIFVEAFSMGVGDLLSDNSAKEYGRSGEVSLSRSFLGALVMFGSYLLSGFLVLVPYLFLEGNAEAMMVSIAVSALALFGLGVASARMSRTSVLRKGLTMMLVGGSAIAIGMLVASLVGRV